MPTATLHRTKAVSRALDIDPRKLTGYLERGLVPCERPGTGAPRLFSRSDITRVALLDRLIGLGVSPARASVIASLHSNASGVLIVDTHGSRVQPLDGDCPIPDSAIVINLEQVAAEVDDRLRAVA